MSVPAELRYTQEHEWVSIDGDVATIGITDYAANALGDVVYVSLPTVDSSVSAAEPCGEVESTKSVSDLFCPVDGEVVEVNEELDDDPGLVNAEPYGAGWMFRVRVPGGEAALPAGLLTAAEYEELHQVRRVTRRAPARSKARWHRAVPPGRRTLYLRSRRQMK